MRDILNGKQAARVLRCAPMKVKKRIEIGEWPGRIIPKSKTGLTCDTISQEEIQRRLAEKKEDKTA